MITDDLHRLEVLGVDSGTEVQLEFWHTEQQASSITLSWEDAVRLQRQLSVLLGDAQREDSIDRSEYGDISGSSADTRTEQAVPR